MPSVDLALAHRLASNCHSTIAVCFLGSIGGELARGAVMVAHAGADELCGDSTRPVFRNRGVQTALLRARLAAASDAGYDLALTRSGSVSQREMERIGLRLTYTKAERS